MKALNSKETFASIKAREKVLLQARLNLISTVLIGLLAVLFIFEVGVQVGKHDCGHVDAFYIDPK